MRSLERPPELPGGRDLAQMRETDCFMDLRTLAKVSGMGVRTLRKHLSEPLHPLPHFRLEVGGKILVRWGEFIRWMEHFRVRCDHVDGIVNEVLEEWRKP
jgi:hypothetical protein